VVGGKRGWECVPFRREVHPLRGHAVGAAQVAALGGPSAQIRVPPPVLVQQHVPRRKPARRLPLPISHPSPFLPLLRLWHRAGSQLWVYRAPTPSPSRGCLGCTGSPLSRAHSSAQRHCLQCPPWPQHRHKSRSAEGHCLQCPPGLSTVTSHALLRGTACSVTPGCSTVTSHRCLSATVRGALGCRGPPSPLSPGLPPKPVAQGEGERKLPFCCWERGGGPQRRRRQCPGSHNVLSTGSTVSSGVSVSVVSMRSTVCSGSTVSTGSTAGTERVVLVPERMLVLLLLMLMLLLMLGVGAQVLAL